MAQHWHLSSVVYDRVFPLGELHDGMAAIIGPDLAKSFFQRKVNSSPPVEIPMAVDLVDRIVAIYEDDLRMISRIK